MTLLTPSFAGRTLAAACAWLLASIALAATTPATKAPAKAAPPVAAKAPAKAPAKPRPKPQAATPQRTGPTTQQAASTAKGLALATATVEAISAGQLDVAARVLTGAAACEFEQRVTVQPLDGVPGYFTVSHKGRHYRMLPRETATGAVRLEDPDQGMVWLQIPTKSMLMDARRGQRMIDNCMHAEQHAAVSAVAAAGAAQQSGIGITPQAALPAPADPPASAAAAPDPAPSQPASLAPAAAAPRADAASR
jgi:hypothetical protein